MIQKIAPPPSLANKQPNPAPVNRPIDLNQPRTVAETTPAEKPGQTPLTARLNPMARYEQTQKFLKDQILSVQKKSRNLKETERTLVIQSIAALSGTLALIIGFIFVFFPLLIRFAGNLGNLTAFTQSDTIPPRIPAITAPVEATQEDHVDLAGFGEPKSKVFVVKNGQEAGSTDVNDAGEFTLTVALDEGQNEIQLYSTDEAKNESATSGKYVINFDKTPPEVDWQSPEEGKVVRNLREQSIEVKGKASEAAKIYLNDQFVANSADGNFSTTFQLQQGDNKLTLKVVDAAQNETTVERTVSFKP